MIINKIKKYKKAILIVSIIILLFLITILAIRISKDKKQQKYIEEETQRVKQYTSLTDFKTIEEVALYLNCKLIKHEDSKQENFSYDIYMELPVKVDDLKTNNRNFTENLIQYSAYVLKYKNFIIIDEKNSTSILVLCNEEQQVIEKYYINDIENYFDVIQNQENIENYEIINPIDFKITSDELNQIMKNNWTVNNLNIGTIESGYRNYNIYFDEGIQIRNVSGKVFNIIFTDKYTKNVINNLGTKSTQMEVEKSLGVPQFESGSLIGYKGKNIYVFFYKNQISIYRIEEYKTDEIANAIERKSSNSSNEKEFVDEIKSIWKDYDLYEYDENYVKLQYTLKGLSIKFDSTTKKGVMVYNNYKGNIYGNTTVEDIVKNNASVPNYIFTEKQDLVFEAEKNRIDTLDDTSQNNNYFSYGVILNTSNKFKIHKDAVGTNKNIFEIRFISINNEFPNSELREMISNGCWYDDVNFVYSVKNRGMYLYNAQTRTYKTIITGKDNFKINYIDNGTIYYDENGSIEVNL